MELTYTIVNMLVDKGKLYSDGSMFKFIGNKLYHFEGSR